MILAAETLRGTEQNDWLWQRRAQAARRIRGVAFSTAASGTVPPVFHLRKRALPHVEKIHLAVVPAGDFELWRGASRPARGRKDAKRI